MFPKGTHRNIHFVFLHLYGYQTSALNTELFIARKILRKEDSGQRLSQPVIRIVIIGIALSLAVMIISTAIVMAFKKEIRDKVIGFGSHIQIINYDTNTSYETSPVSKNQPFYPSLEKIPGIKHIQVFAIKAGIIKTSKEIQGVVIKGIGPDFDWTFFRNNLVEGKTFSLPDSTRSNKVLISKILSDMLDLHVGDHFVMYFIQEPPRMRRFEVSGIYETSLEDFDKTYILADIRHIQRLNNWSPDQVSGFEVTIDRFRDLDLMTWLVRKEIGSNITEDKTPLRVENIVQKYTQIFDWLNLQDMNVWIILILMLIVAAFNMISGLFILILERMNMIGILKALGANNWSIRKIFLYHSSFLILRGLFWGNLIGLGLCYLQYKFAFLKLNPATYYLKSVPIRFDPVVILALNAGTLFIIVIMLIFPSYLISRISPVKTIRYE